MTDIKENGHKWLTIADACQMLSVSERTLRRHMGQGKYETRLEKGRRMVRLIDDDNGQTDDNQRSDALVEQLQSEIQHLRDVVSNRDTQIATLLTELAESNKVTSWRVVRINSLICGRNRGGAGCYGVLKQRLNAAC